MNDNDSLDAPDRISIYCTHICGDWCVDNCELNETKEETIISLVEFDPDNPKDLDGYPIIDIDELVITNKTINIIITYPLIRALEIMFTCEEGHTLRSLLRKITNLYKSIYTEEEDTALPQQYILSRPCQSCSDYTPDSEDFVQTSLEDVCAICYSTDFVDAIKLPCSHKFHIDCIMPWIRQKSTCPLCRCMVRKCAECEGENIVDYLFTGTVIPRTQRGEYLSLIHI